MTVPILRNSATKVSIFLVDSITHIDGLEESGSSAAYGYAIGDIFDGAPQAKELWAVSNDPSSDANDIIFDFVDTGGAVSVGVVGTTITINYDNGTSTYGQVVTALLASTPVMTLINFPDWVAADSSDVTVINDIGEPPHGWQASMAGGTENTTTDIWLRKSGGRWFYCGPGATELPEIKIVRSYQINTTDPTFPQGTYDLWLEEDHTNSLREITIAIRGIPGADPAERVYQIVAYDPDDAGHLGLDFLDTQVSTRLAPTVASRTLDVSATGGAGIDWANVEAPTTTLNLSGTTIKTATDVETDTANIQTRIPAALVSGRIDASVGAMAANVITSSATDGTVISEIQSGLAMATAVSSLASDVQAVFNLIDTEVAAIQADTNDIQTRLPAALVSGRMDSSVGAMSANVITAAATAADFATEINTGMATATALATVQTDIDDIQARLPAALVSGRMDASIGAMAANVLTAGATAADFSTEVNTTVLAAIATAQTSLNDLGVGVTITALDSAALLAIENTIWDALPADHVVVGSYGELGARPTGAVVADAGNSPMTFKTNLTSTDDNSYRDTFCSFLSGALAGQAHKIASYVGSTKFLTFVSGFTGTPVATDRFLIVNK